MEIEIVSDKKGMERFIRFAWDVYKKNPNWAAPLFREMRFIVSGKNPFFKHAEAAFFLAKKENKIVGRIAAIIDHNHIDFHKEKVGFFGFFETLDDPEIASALLSGASNWLKERGIEIMRGPVNPSTNDECGFLLEGFDSPPMIMMSYSPPSYLDYMERCGLKKIKDLYAYISPIGEQVAKKQRLEKLAAHVRAKVPALTIRPLRMKEFERELNAIKEIYNSAWSHNWGFVPMTDEEINCLSKRIKPLIVPELTIMAEINGKPAGFFLALPDYNEVLIKLKGKLGPLGLLKFLWYSRHISNIRVLTMGVKEEFRRKGIEGLLYLESFKAAMRKGYHLAEMSWILEDNIVMQKGCELMGGKLYKKYRIYEKRIAD